ncbi:hypothetical protein Plhal304r1_c038g0115051 [Plasmopara halstedii]
MAEFLLKHSQGKARLPRAVITAAADQFEVHRNTVSRIWNRMKMAMDVGSSADVVMKQVLSKKRGNCGRKQKDYSAAMERVKQLPLSQRSSLRALSSAVGVPRTTLFRLLRNDKFDCSRLDIADDHLDDTKQTLANVIKAPLSDRNKRDRLKFCSSKVLPSGVFEDMINVVHINTKWCFLPGNRDAKKTKAMFLIAVARPQWDCQRQRQFDGKLGVWPFVVTNSQLNINLEPSIEPWVQTSAQPGHTFCVLETITKKEIQTMITSNVIPAIKTKMPSLLRNRPLFIQLDNQQMRLTPDDPVIAEHGKADGWDIQVQYQPAYSPELVVLNHRILKHISVEMTMRNITMQLSPLEALITGVERAFGTVTERQIDDAFLALQKTMECILLSGGSNNFDSQEDVTKKSLQHDGSLPISIICKKEALLACQSILNTGC